MKIRWNNEQLKILEKLEFNFDIKENVTDEQILIVDEVVMNYLQLNCIKKDEITTEGAICESIIEIISELD